MGKTLRLILGDQLNAQHSWFSTVNNEYTFVMIESREEGSYAPHHIQKVVGIFSAMRQFAHSLKSQGHQLHYHKILDSTEANLRTVLASIAHQYGTERIELQEPDEWRLREDLEQLKDEGFKITWCSSEHFISTRKEFQELFEGKKTFLMETFYRALRRRTGILMDMGQPAGGKWNYDAQNRKKLPKNHLPPPPFVPSTDVSAELKDALAAQLPTIGKLKNPKHFYWPTTPTQAWEIFDHWLQNGLPSFGDYQDALTTKSWSLYHSRISFALNTKMIQPLDVCQRVEAHYRANPEVPLNAVEGFIRQILGWREFMRCVYWHRMPEFAAENFFGFDRKLPQWFWNGETKMKCLSHTIGQSLNHGYAHHIQRLMVTGNFTLLAGIDPDEVDLWYLGIYIDAFEWVEITNTRGMSQYADGGWIATKPYVSSANYMKKMGDYCDQCFYNPKTKTEDDSCPFNALYWNFFDSQRDKLQSNFRLGMVYRTYDKMNADVKAGIREKAQSLLDNINTL
ncbi:MAG: cryptochrome/photolyase family protein [Bacteroidetes bacterium]|nr:cryptochrome/photolyase family protein [Bacteroidota bacterium]